MQEIFPILMRCALFAGITSGDLEKLISCLSAACKSLEKGEAALLEGEPARVLGIVLSGSVQVVRDDYYGNRSIMARLSPGDLFAEAFACSGASVMPVSVIAMEPTQVLLIDAQRIMHPCSSACGFHQQLLYNLVRILAAKNLVCNRKIEVTSKRSTRGKLMTYLMLEAQAARSSSFSIPYDRQELADYLEVDRSGLSAEIGRLRREGVLTCEKNRFTLLADPSGNT